MKIKITKSNLPTPQPYTQLELEKLEFYHTRILHPHIKIQQRLLATIKELKKGERRE